MNNPDGLELIAGFLWALRMLEIASEEEHQNMVHNEWWGKVVKRWSDEKYDYTSEDDEGFYEQR